MQPFEGCRLRIERAKAHGITLAVEWNSIPAEDLNTVRAHVNPDGTGRLWISQPKPIPAVLALHFGEMFYQLRAALDGAIHHAAILETGKNPPPDEHKLEFPIFDDPRDYRKNSGRMLGPLKDATRLAYIETVQPYHAPNLPPDELVGCGYRALAMLNDWARKDRHRRLHVVQCWAAGASPQIRCPDGVSVASIQAISSGFLNDNDVLATFRLTGYTRGVKVEANPYLRTEIAINEAPSRRADNDTLGNRLAAMIAVVTAIVAGLENSF
jgi:hypothetical protein